MRKRWMSVIGMLMIAGLFLTPSPVQAAKWKWYLDLGMGYGDYSLSSSWEEVNGFIRDFNSWTRNTLGLDDFELEELENKGNVYSLGLKTQLASQWELGLDASYCSTKDVSEYKIRQVYLTEVDQETLSVGGDFTPSLVMANLMLYWKPFQFSIAPYVGAGLGYYMIDVGGDYYASRDVWSLVDPPFGWEHTVHQTLNESLSISNSSLGYVLAAGISGCLGRLRIGLEARYHQIPKLKGEVKVENEGFSSIPVDAEAFEIDSTRVLTTEAYLMLRF